MPVTDLYSKREARRQTPSNDVFRYDELSQRFRVQVVHIVRDVFGLARGSRTGQKLLVSVNALLCREYGVFALTDPTGIPSDPFFDFFLGTVSVESCLDWIELTFRTLVEHVALQPPKIYHATCTPEVALKELNIRFLEDGAGYQFESGRIVRVDSRFLHVEAVKPSLLFLSEPYLAGANEEFLKAHEHYRSGRNKECVADCLKAFESTMKAICDRRKWPYGANDTAKPLIDVLFKHKLVPDYLQSEFSSLRTVLESGVPTLRNRTSGHGQGRTPVELPAYLASYVLHLTASTILFLCEAEKNLK